jgi:hypothetical protein
MSDKTYNGWTNYATWRINLEVFDGVTLEDMNTVEVDPYEVSQYLKNYAEEIIFLDSHIGGKSPSSLLEDYARAFLQEVNWYEIAEHLIADYEDAAE